MNGSSLPAFRTLGADAGEPVVLLHAFPLDATMWAAVAGLLAPAVRVVLVDLPGLGGSPIPPGEPDLGRSADGVAAVLDRLGLGRAVVAGVSMGGYVALDLLRRYRPRLAALALVDTRADADGEPARQNRERIALAVLGEAGTRALAPMADTLLGPTTHARRPEVVADLRRRLAQAPPAGVAWSQRAMAGRPDSTPLLAGADLPVAVVVGEEDPLSPPEVARAMAAALPDAVLTVLPGAGHLSPLERPDAVAAALLALCTRVRP